MTFNSYYTGIKNKYLYNGGTERQEELDLDLTAFRSYNPAIGRFNQIDPMAGMFSSLSPYHYAYNNPVGFNDPLGLFGRKGKKDGQNEKKTEHEDAHAGSGPVFVHGRLMNPRNNYGQREWSDGEDSYSYQTFMNALNGIGSPAGININNRPLDTYARNERGQYVVNCRYCGDEQNRITYLEYDENGNIVASGARVYYSAATVAFSEVFGRYGRERILYAGASDWTGRSTDDWLKVLGTVVSGFETAVLAHPEALDALGTKVSRALGYTGLAITAVGVVNKIVQNRGFDGLEATDYLDLAVTGATLLFVANPLVAAGIGLTYGVATVFFEEEINNLGSEIASILRDEDD